MVWLIEFGLVVLWMWIEVLLFLVLYIYSVCVFSGFVGLLGILLVYLLYCLGLCLIIEGVGV